MKKKVYIYGLVATMLFSTVPTTYAAKEDIKEETRAIKEESISLSLDKAVEYALLHSKDMEIERLELDKAEVVYNQNRRAVIQNEKSLDELEDSNMPRTYEVTADINVNNALLKNGVSRRSVELAYQVSKWNVELKKNTIEYNVQKAYFDLLQMEKELEIAEENFELSKDQYEKGKLKHNLGVISKQQLLGLEMGVSQAQSVYESTMMGCELQLMSFNTTLGLPLNQVVKLTDKIDYEESEPIDLENSVKTALKNNVGIKIADENNEISKLTLKAISGRFPSNTYKYKEQDVLVQQAAKNLETAKNGVEMSVRGAVLNLQTAEKQISTYKKAVEQAEQALKIAETTFELGKSTSSEVTEANINLMNAKKSLSQQIHAYNLALLDYEYSIGIGKGA
ncbi:TolC family protein [Tissierella sp. Yu-01]|uniref:TolC family protein n=1 Tax=Tissierella sp. Yu-01 TaxID=3035694 RepID=UPI00240E4FD6|nr:TolC family protein [Tissierella sp. Yu-01]WFA08527.1 TolC family protein [Tissierella sp. Yu-01]